MAKTPDNEKLVVGFPIDNGYRRVTKITANRVGDYIGRGYHVVDVAPDGTVKKATKQPKPDEAPTTADTGAVPAPTIAGGSD